MGFGSTAAKSAAQQTMGISTGYGAEAGDIGSMLVPELKHEALHPTGFNPTDLNSMLVAGQQGAGGATGSIAGEANLHAARARNNASLSSVLDEAERGKVRQLSQNALDVQGQNAQLKEKQRQAGLAGLSHERGADINAQLEAQKIVPEDINAWSNARQTEHNTGIFSDVLATIGTLTGAAKAYKPGGF
jgi:hypothetical protein